MTAASSSSVDAGWCVEVDRANAAEWSQLLALFDDASVYQSAAYGEIRWGQSNLSRIVLKHDGEVAAIAQLRIIRPTPLKFGIAYLRWGPLWERRGRTLDPEVPARMVQCLEDEYLKKRKLYLHVIPNAFAGSERAAFMQSAFSRFRPERPQPGTAYRTFVVDLAPPLEQLRKGLDAKWRNKLAGAEKNQLEVIGGTGLDVYASFLGMYQEMWKRKEFDSSVSVEEFGRVQEALPEAQRMRILICKHQGVPAAGIVVSAMGNSAIYLLGATADQGLKSKGAYLLHWNMMQWLKESGIRWYDLGGIDPEQNPGVYSFKKGFSGADVTQLSPMVCSGSPVSTMLVAAGWRAQRVLSRLKTVSQRRPAQKASEAQ